MIVHIPMVPVPKGRPRLAGGHVFTPKRTHDAESFIATMVRRVWRSAPTDLPVSLVVRFWFPELKRKQPGKVPRGDVDNYLKTVMDALNGVVYKDDRQVVHVDASKLYCAAGGEPGIDLEVVALDTP